MLRTLSCCLILIASFAAAKADTFVITSGSANVSGGIGFASFGISVVGPGFSMFGFTNVIVGATAPCSPCGSVLTPNANSTLIFGSRDWNNGFIILNGTTYALQTSIIGQDTRSMLLFGGDSVMLPATGPDETLTYVLEFGMIGSASSNPGSTGPPFSATFSGHGLATIRIIRSANQYRLQNASYVFSTPEPTTMILICSGLVGLAFKLRTRRG